MNKTATVQELYRRLERIEKRMVTKEQFETLLDEITNSFQQEAVTKGITKKKLLFELEKVRKTEKN